jgi:hypothetical protein
LIVVRSTSPRAVSANADIALMLMEMAARLERQGASPFRVAAYRRGALSVRTAREPLAAIFEREGIRGIEQLPAIGTSLAKKIAEMLRAGRVRALERLRRRADDDLLTTLPTIGPLLAARIRDALGIHSLEELVAAAHDGRLRRVAGVGPKRAQAIRDSLARRLGPRLSRFRQTAGRQPPVADLLAIDQLYRLRAAAGRLPRVATKRFNPTGAAWLSVLRTEYDGRRYRAHFANTARSHELGHSHDWVFIQCEDKDAFGQWTIVTAAAGPLRSRRVVRGRERECLDHYHRAKLVQLSLPATTDQEPGTRNE